VDGQKVAGNGDGVVANQSLKNFDFLLGNRRYKGA